MRVVAWCMEWHLTSSPAFDKLLVEPLAPDLDVQLRAWDGERLPEPVDPSEPTVFCMLPPPADLMGERVTWLPMWDQVRGFAAAWWEALPRGLRVVALSQAVAERARAAGLETLRLQYFLDLAELAPATWEDGPVVGYWNRTGLAGPRFLERLCAALGARELIFRPDIDPRVTEDVRYELPDRLGATAVRRVMPASRDEHLRAMAPANVVLAPRVAEGAGLVFLESMARGCATLAFDGPTMNEYIQDGVNGTLLRNARWRTLRRHPAPFVLSEHRNWGALARLDLPALGARAAADHAAGRRAWQAERAAYRAFVAG